MPKVIVEKTGSLSQQEKLGDEMMMVVLEARVSMWFPVTFKILNILEIAKMCNTLAHLMMKVKQLP